MRHLAHLRLAATLLALATVACTPATSTPGPMAGPTTLLTRLGADTVAIEQYTRTPTTMDGVIVVRSPSTAVVRYNVQLGANNAPTGADWSVRRADGTPVPSATIPSASLRFGPDSVRIVGHRASGDTSRSIAVRGEQLPYIGSSYGLFELAIAKLRATGRDSGEFAFVPFAIGATAANTMPIRLYGADSVRVNRFGSWLVMRHDGRGNLTGASGAATTLKVRVDRVASVDIDAIARAWMARDLAVGAMGATSTRDTVRATIGANTHLWVDYGRPSLRGRDVWVNGVLGDTIWRTGANAATQFRTDTDVTIGNATVPAGTYILWTRTTPVGYDLIVNKQTGQWGTEYHADRDLARVPLQVRTAPASVERFTIALRPSDQGGAAMLSFTWGSKELSIPVVAK